MERGDSGCTWPRGLGAVVVGALELGGPGVQFSWSYKQTKLMHGH